MKKQPALLLDLDGTVRRSKKDPEGFIQGPEDIELVPGMEARIMEYKGRGHLIIGVSNQGGVAFGYKKPWRDREEMQATRNLFRHDPFDEIAVCYAMPNGTDPEHSYRSLLRKPDYGMLAYAEVHFYQRGIIIDWDASLMVGDRDEDMVCARKAGVDFMHVSVFLKTNSHLDRVGPVAAEKPQYATARQKEEIMRLLNSPMITRSEKVKHLLNINRFDPERAQEVIEKLKQVIADREDGSEVAD